MVDSHTKACLRAALERLEATHSCGAWEAIESLADLRRSNLDVVIDLKASDEIGVPLILARIKPAEPNWLATLTPARRRVAARILAGQSNKAIARELDLSVGTVKDHVHAILTSTGFKSRAQLLSNAFGGRNER